MNFKNKHDSLIVYLKKTVQDLQSYKTISKNKINKHEASLNSLRAERLGLNKRLSNLEENVTYTQHGKILK